MSIDNDLFESILRGAISANIDDLVKTITATEPQQPSKDSPQEEDDDVGDDKAQKEAQAFDTPTDDEHEELQALGYWSLSHQRQVDSLTIQKSKEEIVRISCENDELRAKTKNNHAMARGRRIDNRLRLQMAAATFRFMQYWCCFVALVVFIYVAKNDGNPPSEVIIALLGTSTISIVGLVGFVVSGLFKSNKDKE
ncbi:hypothetical protein CSB66_4625 [Enterobacter hormaechei]|nr:MULTISPECIES: hypothetical protein [Enterobacter]HAS1142028.1 hypothetical protein [Enterobacter cloacae]AFP71249.1 hypothetical protein ECENHK_17070 [Enterobacter kobei]AOP87998.1 hypothetical protein BFV64_17275 [Enterobacter kobei]ELV2792655.1 hypothetical protein [Enterobacter kobei]MCQ4417815.1 hypothetical protein [Enterobacter kobei]